MLKVVERKRRVARNPRTREAVIVPPRRVVAFKMGRIMRKLIVEGESLEEFFEADEEDLASENQTTEE